jgi:putative transposase
MAVWRRKPKTRVVIHSDQDFQFTSMDSASFLKHHNREHWMSRRGNRQDNDDAESFFNMLNRERMRCRTDKTRVEARHEVFNYIDLFYNPACTHVNNGMELPVYFERKRETRTEGV